MNYQPGAGFPIRGALLAVIIAFYVVLIAFFIWCYVRIIRRAGYSGWWILMSLVPIGNLIMLAFFAFKEWPIRRELDYLHRHAAMTGLPGYGAPPSQYGPGPGQPPAPGPEAWRPEDPDAPRP